VDRIDDVKTEVDVVVEGMINGVPIIIGFEVRNTSRKIDRNGAMAIVTKYQRLVHKTMVVSRKGCTRGALKHFKMHDVTAITLADAIATDWGQFLESFKDLFFVALEISPAGPPHVEYTGLEQPFKPMTEEPVPILKLPDGQQGPLSAAIRPLIRSPEIRDLLMNKWYGLPEKDRPTNYKERVTFTPNADTPWLLEQNGSTYRINRLELPVSVSAHGESFRLQPMQYVDRRVMHGTVNMPDVTKIKTAEMVVSEGPDGDRRATVLIVSDAKSEVFNVQLVNDGKKP
jgi:hypothetical protein